MGLFGKKKVIDLGERYREQQEELGSLRKIENTDVKPVELEPVNTGFNFLGSIGKTISGKSNYENNSDDEERLSVDEKRKRLARRLVEITQRLEDLSTKLYHLQQRIDLIEKKMNIGQY